MDILQKHLQNLAENQHVSLPLTAEHQEFEELIDCLKDKFSKAKTFGEKVLILSILPPAWTRAKCLQIFGPIGASDYLVRKTKELVKENGVLATLNPQPGRPLSDITVKMIQDFYERDETSSKLMPGCRDYVSVRENGARVHKQKRMILTNLKHLHSEYMEEYGATHPVGFSKFAALRPKHCVLAGAAGTHTVCVCVNHENTNLMFESSKLKLFSADDPQPLLSFKNCLSQLMCEKPTPECCLLECKSCPSSDALRDRIRGLFDFNMIENITFRRWSKIDGRYTLEKVIKPEAEFTEEFLQTLKKLIPHHFFTKQQSSFYQEKKANLLPGEVLIISDFAENYSCVMQSEIQGYHWSAEQVTLHPFVAYFKNPEGELAHISYVAVSDHKKHITATFYAFQKRFVPFLKNKVHEMGLEVNKMIYFSDGSSAQYKNRKNAKNISCHASDFYGIKAEWHFFASCHGKGPCDGIGGTLKRCALRASLQGTIIRNATDLYTYAKEKLTNLTVDYFSVEEVDAVIAEQEERFKKVEELTGLASFHCIIPELPNTVLLKKFSAAATSTVMQLEKSRTLQEWQTLTISSYVMVVKENLWCLAQIKHKNDETKTLSVVHFTPPGRARTYKKPAEETVTEIDWNQVLTIATPKQLKTPNSFSIPVSDKNAADKELKLHNETGETRATEDESDPDDPI